MKDEGATMSPQCAFRPGRRRAGRNLGLASFLLHPSSLLLLAMLAGCGGRPYSTDPANASPQRAEFLACFAEWRPFIDEFRQVRKDYATVEPELRPPLRKRYDEMVQKGRALEERLITAAMDACAKQPDENKDVAEFLMGVVRELLAMEDYEEALRVSEALIDHRVGDYSMYYAAALSAFAVGQFEAADRHFKFLDQKQIRLAGRNNPLIPVVEQCRATMDYYKEAWKREKALRDQETAAGDLPRVLLETNKGDIEIELFENEAPNTVANFISLVEQGFYDGTKFFRVLPQFMAQAGCPKGDGTGHPGYTIRCECYQPNHRLHFRGSVSMANAGPNTGGSQFFITFRPVKELDGKHTVFGRVVRGMEVLARLQRREPKEGVEEALLPKPDVIIEAKVLRKRPHEYDPKIIPIEEPDELTKKILEEIPAGFPPF